MLRIEDDARAGRHVRARSDEPRCRLEQVVDVAVEDEPSAREQQQPVGDATQLADDVGREHDRTASVSATNAISRRATSSRASGSRSASGSSSSRTSGHDATATRERDLRLLTAGELAATPVVRDVEALEPRDGARLVPHRVHASAEAEHVAHRERAVERLVLRDDRDTCVPL